jgi:hypothetical protein
MTETIVVVLVFVVLLALEWRYRLKSVRVATALTALVLWFFTIPNPTRAARRAIAMSPAERITVIHGDTLSEYASGVRTMEQAASDDAMAFDKERLLSVGVLLWLACSPVFRRAAESAAPQRQEAHC